jgi:hypothetical protein
MLEKPQYSTTATEPYSLYKALALRVYRLTDHAVQRIAFSAVTLCTCYLLFLLPPNGFALFFL